MDYSTSDDLSSSSSTELNIRKLNYLSDTWTLWAHLPHDTNWSESSYKELYTFNSVEQIIALVKVLPEIVIRNCMLFLMRDGIKPMWEDPKNKDGGCFSYKISNKSVYNIWKLLSYLLVGDSLSDNADLQKNLNGITISPKKNFCIIKIWTADCQFQDPALIKEIDELTFAECLFKKHATN